MEVNSALMVQDLKDAETNMVVVDLSKYLLSYTIEDKPNHIVSPTQKFRKDMLSKLFHSSLPI